MESLLQAIIERALEDARSVNPRACLDCHNWRRCSTCRDSRGRFVSRCADFVSISECARRWLHSVDFEDLCDTLKLSPDFVRRTGGITREPHENLGSVERSANSLPR
jgi:hypothetical protein